MSVMALAVVTPQAAGARELELLAGGGILDAASAAGDGGGVVTLLVQLARELGETGAVDESLLAARAGGLAATEALGPGARITRLLGGPGEDVQVHELAAHRAPLEHAVEALART